MKFEKHKNLIYVDTNLYNGLPCGTYRTNDLDDKTGAFFINRDGLLLQEKWKYLDERTKYKVCIPDKPVIYNFNGLIKAVMYTMNCVKIRYYLLEFHEGILTEFTLTEEL